MPRTMSVLSTARTRTGRSQGARALRASATDIPTTRMIGSQITNSFTLIQKPSLIASNDSLAWKPSKKVSRTRPHPGRADEADREQGEDDDRHRGGRHDLLDAQAPAYAAALELAGAG